MALGERQTILYTDVVDIYIPLGMDVVRVGHNDIRDLTYEATPSYPNVKCFRGTERKLGKAKFFGRESQETTTANVDAVCFDAAQSMLPDYVFQVKNTTDSDYLEWFLVLAMADVNDFHANQLVVSVRRTTKPPGVT